MKRFLALILVFGAAAVFVPAAEARTTTSVVATSAPQLWRGQPRRYRRGAYSVVRTRTVRVGFRTYRERYRITYLPNGRTRTQVVSRVRIR